MITKELAEELLKEAENRIVELEQFRQDSANLNLNVIEDEFLILKRFYQERVDILKMVLKIPSLPF